MEISAAVAADLALLSAALDEPDSTVVETVHRLAADARVAVRSYLGLRVLSTGDGPTFAFTIMTHPADSAEVLASLMMPLTRFGLPGRTPELAVILYAATEGAFVDLAADLAWLAGCSLEEFALDRHLYIDLDLPAPVRHIADESVVNQAIGVLLSRGLTPQQADRELDIRAAAAGTDRRDAAVRILADLDGRIDGTEDEAS